MQYSTFTLFIQITSSLCVNFHKFIVKIGLSNKCDNFKLTQEIFSKFKLLSENIIFKKAIGKKSQSALKAVCMISQAGEVQNKYKCLIQIENKIYAFYLHNLALGLVQPFCCLVLLVKCKSFTALDQLSLNNHYLHALHFEAEMFATS